MNSGHENDSPEAGISPIFSKKQIWHSTSGTGLTVHEIWIGRLQQLWSHRWPCGFGCLSQFSLEKYMSVFLELCQRKGSSSFTSLLALGSSNLHVLCLCPILGLMGYTAREISFVCFLRMCSWDTKMFLTGSPSQEGWRLFRFSVLGPKKQTNKKAQKTNQTKKPPGR